MLKAKRHAYWFTDKCVKIITQETLYKG